MASEILRRNPTSTGNRRVFTWAGWVKFNKLSAAANCIWYAASAGNSEFNISLISSTGALNVYDFAPNAYQYQYVTSRLFRDFSNWFHLVVAVDTTQVREDDRFKIYVNGVLYNGSYFTETTTGGINYQTRMNTPGQINVIGQNTAGGATYDANCELTDLFMIDGQALTPDVFGFYKQGKGYISAGSAQATDFRPGQWVPKTPRVIKTEINRRGGFGVNGFYLPMNDSNNFGADFHGDPNSIITLNEKLPQPRVGVASTASVGLGYTDVLRSDPYAANLVLALPFVSSGLSSGFGDYAPSIKGSGTAKTIVSTSATIANVSTASTSSLYYGSGASFNNSGIGISFASSSDFAFGTGDYTVECWIHRNNASSALGNNGLWSVGAVNAVGSLTLFYEDSAFMLRSRGTGDGSYTNDFSLTSSNFSTQQWNHFAVCRKGTTVTLYANGVAAGISTTSSRNVDANPFIVGSITSSGLYPFFGFMQDLRVYKGVAKYTGGFDVPRPYTPVGIATWRQVPDTTANNFATMNPLSSLNVTYSNGNLSGNISQTTGSTYAASNIGVSTGKWYWETRWDTDTGGGNGFHIGVASDTFPFGGTTRPYQLSSGFAYLNGGSKITNNSSSSYGASYTIGDILGTALDMDNKTVSFYKNGSNQGIAFTFTSGSQSMFVANSHSSTTASGVYGHTVNFGQNPTFSGNTTAGTFTDTNGKGLFKYQPPSDFLALCEDNLPTPAISDPGKYFKTVLYTGDGASGRSIVGVGFTPDLVWVKDRNNGGYNHLISDSVRGAGFALRPSSTNEETSSGMLAFNTDGFSITSDVGYNASGNNHVAWCWRAGAGTTSTNTNGSITSVVSVNQDAGFSIVSYRSNGTSGATVGHQLNKTPSFIIVKMRSSQSVGSSDWAVYHKSLGATKNVWLNATNGANTSSAYWNNTEPTSSVFSLGNDLDTNHTNGYDYISYCWAEIEGFSKFGSWIGNGNADGPFIWTGFTPAFVLFKNASSAYNWYIVDNVRSSVNPVSATQAPNLTTIEDTGWATGVMDFTSNGFKLRGTNLAINESGSTFIFAAFAQSPFAYSNSK
jgi:hypothetical protein